MGRTLVWLLLLFNVLYGSWAQGWLLPYGFGPTPQREPQRLAQQIHPEMITILSQAEAEAGRKPLPEMPESILCLQSGLMEEAQAETVRPYLEASWPLESWVFELVAAPERWLVYLGKYASQAEFIKKRTELSGMQVSAEPVTSPDLSPGLSLGAYPSQAQADAALQALRLRGVRSARVVQESAGASNWRLRLPAVNARLQARLPELSAVLPPGVLESCPEPEAAR